MIPIKAIALNVLSVSAALGVVTYVFQDGHFEDLLNFDSTGAITAWFPLMLFVILFGLSMDYHVFILSRIKEAVDRGESTSDAVSHGIKSTASVVSAAAIVMVAVFSIFATLSFVDMKQFGVGLAVAVLIDATLVRGVLLPATMKLLGEWTGTCRGGSSGCRRAQHSQTSRSGTIHRASGASGRPLHSAPSQDLMPGTSHSVAGSFRSGLGAPTSIWSTGNPRTEVPLSSTTRFRAQGTSSRDVGVGDYPSMVETFLLPLGRGSSKRAASARA